MDDLELRKFYTSINKQLHFLNDVDLNADGDATVKLITQTINQYSNSEFIKNCVAVIDSISQNDFEFCKKLFEVSCALVKYRRDPPGHEIVFTPMLLVRVGKGDCKKFTTWICAVLKCKGINSASKVVSYDPDFGWKHIYSIAFYPNEKGYITLDPVNSEQFNKEVSYKIGRVNFYNGTYSKLIMAKLSIMGNVPKNETFFGIGEASDIILGDLEEITGRRHKSTFRHQHEAEQMYIAGMSDMICGDYEDSVSGEDDEIGKIKLIQKVKAKVKKAEEKAHARKVIRHSPEKKAERKEKRQKIIKKLKTVGFAPARAAFLTIILAGGELAQHTPIKFNLAVKLAELWQKDNGATIKAIWTKFGGKVDSLKNAIVKASKVQISGQYNGIGSAAVIIAAVTAAAPILALVIKALVDKHALSKQQGTDSAGLVEDIEHANTTADGDLKPDLLPIIKTALPLVDDAIKTDDGGDKEAQKQIVQTVTPNDQVTLPTPAQQNFTSQSSSSDSTANSSSSDSSSDSAAKTSTPTDSTTDTPAPDTHAGFNLLNASSWLTGSIQFPLGLNIVCPGHEIISSVICSAMFATSMYLFLNKYFKTKTIKT